MTEDMSMAKKQSTRGFTLVELMIAMGLAVIVMGAAASLFRMGMNSAILIQQKTEAQQNMRAGMDLMVKDLALAGAGLPSGGIQLPTGTGNTGLSKFGCDQSGTCYIVNDTYPANGASTNYMYGIIPGYENGVQGGVSIGVAPSPPNINDSVTVIYADYNFPWSEYNATFTTATGSTLSLTAGTGYTPPLVTVPGGLQQGDLIMVTGSGVGGGPYTAVGEVTNVVSSGTGGTTTAAATITFGSPDKLNFNQPTATGSVQQVAAATVGSTLTTMLRLYVITYYLSTSTAAYPGAPQVVHLMRQVNGLTPVAVADQIVNLQFAFDTYNSTTAALDANEPNPIGVGESPNNIQKINLVVMAESVNSQGNKSQGLYLATDISARNMSFRQSY
jgi:prepilin-type N-terminal cleavage/methylation domain-containing protein